MTEIKWHTEKIKLSELVPMENNPRQLTDKQYDDLKTSLKIFNLAEIPVINTDGTIIAGHQRIKILRQLSKNGIEIDVRVPNRNLTNNEIREYNIRSNKNLGEWDWEALANYFDVGELTEWGFTEDELQFWEDEPEDETRKTLAEKFIVPPFSVLDTKQGYWQDRKKAWLSLGIKSEVGRCAEVFGTGKASEFNSRYDADKRSNLNNAPPMPEYSDIGMANMAAGTSIFDPVLCELAYKWFMPEAGKILDPFAGGSVRGIVAHILGYSYTGIDLSEKQILENRKQAKEIVDGEMPKWIVGDSNVNIPNVKFDLVFSSPPYGDLEVYSEKEEDISNMEHDDFMTVYRSIIQKSVDALKGDRFACFVVGDFRDKKGFYRNFVSDTIAAFHDAGAVLYNEMILVTMLGSLPIRVAKAFNSRRKVGKTHQNVLVFYKGDPKQIKSIYSELDFSEVEYEANEQTNA